MVCSLVRWLSRKGGVAAVSGLLEQRGRSSGDAAAWAGPAKPGEEEAREGLCGRHGRYSVKAVVAQASVQISGS